MKIYEIVDKYREDFELFESPNEKFEYIFELGKKHKTLDEKEKNSSTFIEGCASPAWLVAECQNGKLILRGEGTSEMAKGMLTLLLDIFSGHNVDEVLSFNPNYLQNLGIIELLSPVRQQSLEAFLKKVYEYAERCKSSKATL